MGFIKVSTFTVCLALTAVAQQQFSDPCRQLEAEGRGCSPGEECRLVQTACETLPCPPTPQCIQITKDGSCPNTEGTFGTCVERCTNDGSCPGSQKCCSNGCGHTCQNPVVLDPCQNKTCGLNQVCRVQDVACVTSPCPPQAICEEITKDGSCPSTEGTFGTCVERCTNDGSCPGSQKCCSNGCGHTCQNPVVLDPCQNKTCGLNQVCRVQDVACVTSPCPPQAICEEITKDGSCPSTEGTFGTCVERCTNDGSCPGSQKCCSNGCGHTCQNPVVLDPCQSKTCGVNQVCRVQDVACVTSPCPPQAICEEITKDGSCPNTEGTFGTCVERCTNDGSCPGSQKCCSNGCGHTCQNPVVLDPCQNKTCGLNQVCRVQDVACVTSPCPPQAICEGPASTTPLPVTTTTRPGRCPRRFPLPWFLCDFFLRRCDTDNDCPSRTKCCFASGCRRRACLRPRVNRRIGGW